MMLLETWLVPVAALIIEGSSEGPPRSASVLRIARILRVFRTARIIRVARYMPELMILVKGLIVAARSVFFTLVLLLLITYVFSIALSQMSHETAIKEVYFKSMPSAILTLVVPRQGLGAVSESSWMQYMVSSCLFPCQTGPFCAHAEVSKAG